MTQEIYEAILFEEDLLNPEKEYRLTAYATFEAPAFYEGQCEYDGGWTIEDVYCGGEPVEIEELAPRLYKWCPKLKNERAMTASELEDKIIEALNDQFDNKLPF
jgi:hypothetical protein